MMKSLKIIVKGKVQGVWFRASTVKIAVELELNGFVQNEPDGVVYIEVSGKDINILKFIEWVLEGPELSVVERVCIRKNTLIHNDGFTIK